MSVEGIILSSATKAAVEPTVRDMLKRVGVVSDGIKEDFKIEGEDILVIRSIRYNPRENVWIYSPCVYSALACKCSEDEFVLWGSESEMVDEVIRNPSIIEDGFKPIGKEIETPYGKVDLIGEDSNGNMVIIEFKRSTAQLQAVSQLKRYVDYYKSMGKSVRGIIVAPSITNSARRLLKEHGLEYRKLTPKSSSSNLQLF